MVEKSVLLTASVSPRLY